MLGELHGGPLSAQLGLEMLARAGLVMQAVFPIADLPEWAVAPLLEDEADLGRYQSLVMLGQGGPRLWEHIAAVGPASQSRFDEASLALAERFVSEHLEGVDWRVVYPGEALLPLGRLAELAGWGRPSPLGLTINDEYGLWLAHRIVFLVDADLEAAPQAGSIHPCDTCLDKPCVAACPVGAVDAIGGFDVDACATFRIAEDSTCANQCLARLACPVGVEHQYGRAQMTYHYQAGLESIRRFYEA